MVYPAIKKLGTKRVILASTSPRRKELFDRLGINYEVIPSGFAEDLEKSSYSSPAAYSAATCKQKAEQVLMKTTTMDPVNSPSLIVSADTIVVCNGIVYEKPLDRKDAKRMLMEISGKVIQVVTAVTVIYRTSHEDGKVDEYKTIEFDETTEMSMVEMNEELIESYLELGQGMDHSGALSYQGGAFILVARVNGCFYNLIGFPATRFYQILSSIQDLIV